MLDHHSSLHFQAQQTKHFLNHKTLSDAEAFSISAAQSAAPTVLVYENAIEANGIISKAKDAIPKLPAAASVSNHIFNYFLKKKN